jgi:hypothetical protein
MTDPQWQSLMGRVEETRMEFDATLRLNDNGDHPAVEPACAASREAERDMLSFPVRDLAELRQKSELVRRYEMEDGRALAAIARDIENIEAKAHKPQPEQCNHCRFWLQDDSTLDPNDADWAAGRCRRNPPVVIPQIAAMLLPKPEYGH